MSRPTDSGRVLEPWEYRKALAKRAKPKTRPKPDRRTLKAHKTRAIVGSARRGLKRLGFKGARLEFILKKLEKTK